LLPEIDLSKCTYVGAFLTLRCNYHCSYCINRHGTFNPRHEMTADEWIQGLNRLYIDRRRMVPITFQGGEPTVHREWPRIVSGVKDEWYIDMLTNLTFHPDELIFATPPERWEREVPYAPIRASYHPEQANYNELLLKVQKLEQWGFDIGIFVVAHPTVNWEPMKRKAESRGLDFRIKEFLGWHDGVMYGEYRYPEAVNGRPRTVMCRTHEFLIAPDGFIHRCHRDLYAGENPVGHLLDPELDVEFKFRPCEMYGCCNECDVKNKNNRFQEFGSCSVEIKDLTDTN
jgi:hypothetical protein